MTELSGPHLSGKVGFTLCFKAIKMFICRWIFFSLLFDSFSYRGDEEMRACLQMSVYCWATREPSKHGDLQPGHTSPIRPGSTHPPGWFPAFQLSECWCAHECTWVPGAVCVPRRGGVWKDSEVLADQGRQQEKGTQNCFSSLCTLTYLSHWEELGTRWKAISKYHSF